MKQHKFGDIDLSDPFFDSLKEDYPEFTEWYTKKTKSDTKAFIQKDQDGKLQGFLYMKHETEELNDINPPMPAASRLKVGTFKIDAHNTKLGEHFIKKIVAAALYMGVTEIYVTIFEKHQGLIKILRRYGFTEYGTKGEGDTPELVFIKSMTDFTGDMLLDYPFIHTKDTQKFILAVKPEFHTPLFPDSILNTEERNKEFLVRDVAHTNSIHKIYLSSMNGLDKLKKGDILVIYRTADGAGPAKYRSVASSICVVEEVRKAKDFATLEEFLQYANLYSIFDEDKLKEWYTTYNMVVIKMTYNAAFDRRITRNELIEQVGLSADYWGFFQLTDEQFNNIISRGKINESIIID